MNALNPTPTSNIVSFYGSEVKIRRAAMSRCERMQTTSMRSPDVLQRLFDFFVHMASDTMPYELDSATLADKVAALPPVYIHCPVLHHGPGRASCFASPTAHG